MGRTNRKYLHVTITIDDLMAEGRSWNVRSARAIITEALEAVDAIVRSKSPVDSAYAGLQDDLARFTANLLAGRPTGYAK